MNDKDRTGIAPMTIPRRLPPAFACLFACALFPAAAAWAGGGARLCIAPSSASLIGLPGEDAGAAVDGAFERYLAGPAVAVVRLQSRLPSQARQEAAGLQCTHTLFATVKHERRSSGFGERLVAGALYSGANQATALAGSAGVRVLAGATAGAAATIATSAHVRTRDRISMSYRLEDAGGRTLRSGEDRRSAGADGEDLLTPMVEAAAGAVMEAVDGGRDR